MLGYCYYSVCIKLFTYSYFLVTVTKDKPRKKALYILSCDFCNSWGSLTKNTMLVFFSLVNVTTFTILFVVQVLRNSDFILILWRVAHILNKDIIFGLGKVGCKNEPQVYSFHTSASLLLYSSLPFHFQHPFFFPFFSRSVWKCSITDIIQCRRLDLCMSIFTVLASV